MKDSVRVTPIKADGKLHSDSSKKADLLNNQFQSVFGTVDPWVGP